MLRVICSRPEEITNNATICVGLGSAGDQPLRQLFGQASATGAVNGPVTDPAGQVVAEAKVVLLNESTNLPTSVTTNAEGQYRIQNVLPARYSLSVQGAGFKAVQVSSFRVNVNQTLTVDVALQLAI